MKSCSWCSHIVCVFLMAVSVNCTKMPTNEIETVDTDQEVGNECQRSTPWPCKTPNFCLSFDYICDGELDCPDGYDEDTELCTAKLRPPKDYLAGFIERYQEWLIPNFFGKGTPNEIAMKLVESPTIVEYAKEAHLTSEQLENLKSFMQGVVAKKEIQLLLLGMPLGAWSELYYLFNRVATSGFLGSED